MSPDKSYYKFAKGSKYVKYSREDGLVYLVLEEDLYLECKLGNEMGFLEKLGVPDRKVYWRSDDGDFCSMEIAGNNVSIIEAII